MGTRTPDLLAASQALYQLSYGPAVGQSSEAATACPEPFHARRGASRLHSNFIDGIKHLPAAWTPGPQDAPMLRQATRTS